MRGDIREFNALMADFAASSDFVTFIDTAPALLTEDGDIDGTLFGPDRLHFNDAGYTRFAAAIRPALLDHLEDPR